MRGLLLLLLCAGAAAQRYSYDEGYNAVKNDNGWRQTLLCDPQSTLDEDLYFNAMADFGLSDGWIRDPGTTFTMRYMIDRNQGQSRVDCKCWYGHGCIRFTAVADILDAADVQKKNWETFNKYARSCELWWMLKWQLDAAKTTRSSKASNSVQWPAMTVDSKRSLFAVVPLRLQPHTANGLQDEQFPYGDYKNDHLQVLTVLVRPVDFISSGGTSTLWTKFKVESVVVDGNATLSQYYSLFRLDGSLTGKTLAVDSSTFLLEGGAVLDAAAALAARKTVPVRKSNGDKVFGIKSFECTVPASLTMSISFERQYQNPILSISNYEATNDLSWFKYYETAHTDDLYKQFKNSAQSAIQGLTNGKSVDVDSLQDGWGNGFFRTCMRRKISVTAIDTATQTSRCMQAPSTAVVRQWATNCAGECTAADGTKFPCGATEDTRKKYARCMIMTTTTYALDPQRATGAYTPGNFPPPFAFL